MLNRNQVYLDRRGQNPAGSRNDGSEESTIVTFVSMQTKGDLHSAESRRADIYQQALSIMPATLENERRSNDLVAGLIVTTLLFFLGAALAGLFLGAMLGKGFVPVEQMLVALFAIAVISVIVLGVALALMLGSKQEEAQPSVDQTLLQQILIPVPKVNPRVLIPVQEVNRHVLVPVKELNPRPRAGRRKTD